MARRVGSRKSATASRPTPRAASSRGQQPADQFGQFGPLGDGEAEAGLPLGLGLGLALAPDPAPAGEAAADAEDGLRAGVSQ
jgi:hypothetical protein